MKLRSSLNVYFLVVMVVFGAGMAFVFSTLAFKFYEEGRDSRMTKLMVDAAIATDLTSQPVVTQLGYTVTEDWNLLPEEIRQRFENPPGEAFELNKRFVRLEDENRRFEIHFLVSVTDGDQPPRYVTRTLTRGFYRRGHEERTLRPYGWSIVMGLLIATGFSVLLLITLRLLVRPLEKLRAWAGGLSVENLQDEPPEFSYREFTDLANIVGESLGSVKEGLDKEQEILRYASHELRTPLAVMRGNVDLLQKLEADPESPTHAVVQRMDRAATTMTQLIQTLLWLQRDEEARLEKTPVALDELTKEIVDELAYLTKGKEISVKLETAPHELHASQSACRIAISNLVRNACQHTSAGTVSIRQDGATLVIENENTNATPGEANELGFGLGMRLLEKLSQQFGWQFSASETATGGFVAKLEFGGVAAYKTL